MSGQVGVCEHYADWMIETYLFNLIYYLFIDMWKQTSVLYINTMTIPNKYIKIILRFLMFLFLISSHINIWFRDVPWQKHVMKNGLETYITREQAIHGHKKVDSI